MYFEKDGEYFPQNTAQANREERITSPKSRKVCEKYSLVAKKGGNLGKNLKQLCEIHSLVKIYHDTLPEKCGFRSLEDITSCGRRSLVVIRFVRKAFTCQWRYRGTICVFCSLVK